MYDPLHRNLYLCVLPVNVHKSVKFMLQYTSHIVDVVHVSPLDPVKFTEPIRDIFCVIVREEPLNVAVSCGNGTRDDHVAVDQIVPAEQSVVAGVVNVIPEFPPQSPELPVMADKSQLPTPAPVMSWKSAFVTDTVAAVIVLAVHNTFDVTRILQSAEFNQFIVKVFDTVKFEFICRVVPVFVGLTVRL